MEVKTVIGAIGDKSSIDASSISHMPGVEAIVPIMKPYKLVGRELHKEPSVVDVGGGVKFGGKELVVIAGPCAIEGEEQIYKVAEAVKASGAKILRGGAFKPRTSLLIPGSSGGRLKTAVPGKRSWIYLS